MTGMHGQSDLFAYPAVGQRGSQEVSFMRKEYLTISHEAVAELEERKSRFIATVRPVTSEEDANSFISELKTKYWNASHNVYAYYICANNMLQKFSDDGEPSGTAGLPVLEAIKKSDLQDIAVVVTRYFGGTKLGAAGLVRAYGKSATMGIQAAGIVKKQLCILSQVTMEYTLLGKVQAMVASNGYRVKDTIYAQDVDLLAYIPVDELEEFTSLINEATNGQALIDTGEKVYITIEM